MSNRVAREKLEKLFGAKCFIEKLHLRKGRTGVKRKFRGSKKRRKSLQKLTYHHIIEKHLGGEASVENGALLSEENHEWFHKQPISDQINMDKKFQEYKVRVLKQTGKYEEYQGGFNVPEKKAYKTNERKNRNKKENTFKESLKYESGYQGVYEETPSKFSRAKRKANDRELFKEYIGR